MAHASMLWPASALTAPFNDGAGGTRLTLKELADMGWIEAVDAVAVAVAEEAAGTHSVQFVGQQP